MAELVDRTGLPEDAALVGVGEEGHQPPWQATAERQPAPRDLQDGLSSPGGPAGWSQL